MTKYKFAKEIEDFLNVLKDAGGFGIEDMEPIEARKLDLIEQEIARWIKKESQCDAN